MWMGWVMSILLGASNDVMRSGCMKLSENEKWSGVRGNSSSDMMSNWLRVGFDLWKVSMIA